jgi:hypothetical protein
MFTKLISWLTVASLLAAASPALATPNSIGTLNTPGTTRTLHVPQSADHSPVISLGTAIDPQTGALVEGYAIIHYKKANAKGGHGGGGGGTTCYAYLGRDTRWKTVESWLINTTNADGLTDAFVLGNTSADILKWEDAADGIVGNGFGSDILGNGTSVPDALDADMDAPDGLNEVYFGAIDNPNIIAVTIVWGTFSGPPSLRNLVEWDMVFNEAYSWSASGEASKMDFENIATHELGHATGLADLYNSSCSLETMYGYSDFGETLKRDLHQGDITGIDKLY